MDRLDILSLAGDCISGNRQEDYGEAEDNFGVIARLWNVYLQATADHLIDAKDVAAMMALLKLARIASGHAKSDNWIDLAGYAACGGEIESKRGERVS